ncbi:hypothetical protein [Caldalkalibacillus mannanilyticus]|uniref:hypothetical protein n=1 Tax=Caldalkalibacillus mannanilyticus TaxID=1418 RepID=UPI000467F2C9|nr:hypothetical protein [Caldalkalibacillus mannanilyticus]
MYCNAPKVLYKLSPGQNVFVWFDASGFIFAKFIGIVGNQALFQVGGFTLYILLSDIRAIAV